MSFLSSLAFMFDCEAKIKIRSVYFHSRPRAHIEINMESNFYLKSSGTRIV